VRLGYWRGPIAFAFSESGVAMKKHRRLYPLKLLSELKRRKVYPVVVAYTLAAWVLLQIGEVTFEPLGLPGWVMTGLIITVVIGLPVVVTLAWLFDVTLTGPQDSVPQSEINADDTPSVAVMPFTDMSLEQDQQYFCEGIAEAILNALIRIPGLRVAARMSSFQYQIGSADIREIGRELGVKAVLEGSLRKSNEQLRISVQLVSVADGYHLWTQNFDEEVQDIFAIQDDIAAGVAQCMLETLQPLQATRKTDITAYDYYLRGRRFLNRLQRLDIEFAMQMFRKAISIDPDFVLAWTGYADCHSLSVMYINPVDSYRDEATRASVKAIDLDPELAEAHASRGLAYLVCENFNSAEAELERAIELNPALYEAYYYFGRVRFHQGDMEAAADWFKQATEVNPADYQARLLRVQILRGLGHEEQAQSEARMALAIVEKHLEWNPDDARAMHLGAGSLILLGDVAGADLWLQRAIEIDPDNSVLLYNVACNYATLGRTEQSLDLLEQAIEKGTVSASWMRNDEDLVSLRDSPKYDELLARLETG
jgi:adenylate cyclase